MSRPEEEDAEAQPENTQEGRGWAFTKRETAATWGQRRGLVVEGEGCGWGRGGGGAGRRGMREGGKGVGLALFLPMGRKLQRVDTHGWTASQRGPNNETAVGLWL